MSKSKHLSVVDMDDRMVQCRGAVVGHQWQHHLVAVNPDVMVWGSECLHCGTTRTKTITTAGSKLKYRYPTGYRGPSMPSGEYRRITINRMLTAKPSGRK